jgi:hypothetical protein
VQGLRCAVAVLALLFHAAGALAQVADEPDTLREKVERLFREGKYAEALSAQRELAAITEKEEAKSGCKPVSKTAEALTSVAW